ncbi:MAG TPA: ABC transporter substrate-binding protein [Clostridiaceae bacterium]|nr:ABC transporter substrate-binding protein [Clostridiaceae bacterium]
MAKRKLMYTLLACMLVLSVLLTGCGGKGGTSGGDVSEEKTTSSSENEESTAKEGAKEPPVKLTFYTMNGPVNEFDRIMGKANEIIEKEINATLDLILISEASYAEKMNLMINSGDYFDLCFTASWGGMNFYKNASKGAYADLTDLIQTYAPQSYSRIPEGLWEGVKINGRIYAVVNYQQWGAAARKGFAFRKDLAEEVGFDWKAVKGKPALEALRLIDPFIGAALKKHPDMIGWETTSTYSFFANEPLLWDMEPVGDMTTPGWVRFTEPAKVINQFETPEFAEYCDIMRDWHLKGYVRKDGATLKDHAPDRQAAKIIAAVYYGWPDTLDSEAAGISTEGTAMSMCTPDVAPAVTVSTTRTVIPAAAGSTAAVAISARSNHIEKSLELIELLNTNDELYLLITNGEEGIDYEFDENGNVKYIEGKYFFNYYEWTIGQSYSPNFTRVLYAKNETGEALKKSQGVVFKADREADVSPVSGFIFDPTPVKTQLANCNAVITEMIPALSNGAVDPKKALPEFLERLKTAGVDDIIKEKQAQLDAWLASK